MSKSTWTGAISSDWADPDNWSPAGVPGVSSDVVIASGAPVASASIGKVNSITDSSHLSFESAGTNTVATFLDDTAHLRVDANGGEGGTILNIGGTLTNSHHLVIGNATLSASDEVTASALDNTGKIYLTGSSANQALLDVTGSAGFGTAGVLSGYARLAGDSAIEFKSGEITSLAAGAHLGLVGNEAFIEDSTALGKNSALMGLASIGAGALFALHDGATVSTTGALVNNGNVYLDTGRGDGGSSLNIGGALTDSGTLGIGNTMLSASVKVTATSFDNAGKIRMTGAGANEALLDVTGGAGFGTAGVFSGNVQLSGDSAIEFAGGQITSLAANAQLELNGSDAFIEDSTALGSSSALTGLASIGAGARFDVENGASVTTGALANDWVVELGGGGSTLTVAGALTNTGTIDIGASDKLTAASLDNTNNGSIYLNGSGASLLLTGPANLAGYTLSLESGASVSTTGSVTNSGALELDASEYAPGGSTMSIAGVLTNTGGIEIGGSDKLTAASLDNTDTGQIFLGLYGSSALLDVTNGAAGFGTAGVFTGNVQLYGDSAIEFASGQISTIVASSILALNGDNAFIEDSTMLGSNSALAGLANIEGYLALENNVSVSTIGSVTNSGHLELDNYYFPAGSTLSIGGALTNTGMLEMGGGNLSSSDSVTAKSFANSGTVDLTGNGTNFAALNVLGATTNNGSISIASDTEELAGAVGGAGSFSLSNAHLRFDSSVSAGQTIKEAGADALVLEQAQKFAAAISGFGTGDTIDATNFHAPPATTLNFVENSGGTGGTLTLHDGSLTANILMTGHYSNSDFTLAPDHGTGTLVKFV